MGTKFRIRIVTDQAWRNLYWAPDIKKLRKDIRTAIREFEEQFPEACFTLAREEENWDFPDFSSMRDFPFPLIRDLSNTNLFRELIQQIVERMRELKIDSPLHSQKKQQEIAQILANKPKKYQFEYLIGYLDNTFIHHMLSGLRRQFPRKKDEFILGFTGIVFLFGRDFGGCCGVAEIGGEYAAFPMQYKVEMPHVIIHELGHLMGAKHPENRDVVSVMNHRHMPKTHRFDQGNVRIIRGRIAQKVKDTS